MTIWFFLKVRRLHIASIVSWAHDNIIISLFIQSRELDLYQDLLHLQI